MRRSEDEDEGDQRRRRRRRRASHLVGGGLQQHLRALAPLQRRGVLLRASVEQIVLALGLGQIGPVLVDELDRVRTPVLGAKRAVHSGKRPFAQQLAQLVLCAVRTTESLRWRSWERNREAHGLISWLLLLGPVLRLRVRGALLAHRCVTASAASAFGGIDAVVS